MHSPPHLLPLPLPLPQNDPKKKRKKERAEEEKGVRGKEYEKKVE
jgi:hypothetical protein